MAASTRSRIGRLRDRRGGRRVDGRLGGPRGGERFGEQAARELRIVHQRPDGLHHHRGFERFFQDRVAAGAAGFVFIERLEQPRGQDHAHVAYACS